MQSDSRAIKTGASMTEKCCDILGTPVSAERKWFRSRKANSEEWIPVFLSDVDKNKCTGCGMCVRVCLGNCYEMQEIIINENKKKIAMAIRPENCFGDCHCHKVCPVPGGAMVCKPKSIE